ncbi:hypothetical protein APA_2938 [Pseudanabaena sp. lw0831]|nr:hypothetical protein APA_2938 [Pseudanabaena sp. lw0831]
MSNNAMSLEDIAKGIKISDLYHIKPKFRRSKPKIVKRRFTIFGFN